MRRNIFTILFILLGVVGTLQAQEDRNKSIIQSAVYGLEYEIKAGFNVGGTAPLPLPEEMAGREARMGYYPRTPP